MNSNPTFILLTNDSIQAKALLSALLQTGLTPVAVIVERKAQSSGFKVKFKKQLRLWLKPFLLYLKYDKNTRKVLHFERECELNAQKDLINYVRANFPNRDVRNIPHIHVQSVNSEAVKDILRKYTPDYGVVYGTGIIKLPVLDLAGKGFINVHSSILPYYKGTRSEFWQCWFEDYEHTGISVHKVDTGVDTGEIYEQFNQEITKVPNPFSLRVGNNMLMLKNYPPVLKRIFNGEIQPRTNPTIKDGKTYRMSDITFEKRIELYSRLLKLKS